MESSWWWWWWCARLSSARVCFLQGCLTVCTWLIFTVLDCVDWVLGCFYTRLDAWLQSDYAGSSQESTAVGVGQAQSVCICQRVSESARARRLRSTQVEGGVGHECTCWGWELGEDAPQDKTELQKSTGALNGEVISPEAEAPSMIDPLAQSSPHAAPCNGHAESAYHAPVLEKGGTLPADSTAASPGSNPSATEESVHKKRRTYVGRWTDCQCPHCTVLRSQSHRRLFVRYAGRGSEAPSESVGQESGGVSAQGQRGNVVDSQRRVSPAVPAATADGAAATKPDLLLLHGYSASSNMWADTIFRHLPPAFLASRRVFAPDLLGTGKSPRPHGCHYTLKDHVEAIEASVLAAHNVQSFHIVGHSMGTLMAVVLAARNLPRVLSVTLLAPVYAHGIGSPNIAPCVALNKEWTSWPLDRLVDLPAVLWPRFLGSIPRWYLHCGRLFSHVLFSNHLLLERLLPRVLSASMPASFVSDFLRDSYDVQMHMFNNTLLAGGHALHRSYEALAAAGMRILVDHGTCDETCPLPGSVVLAQRYSNVELRQCEGVDHLHVVLDREREVTVEIVEEIARAESKSRQARAAARQDGTFSIRKAYRSTEAAVNEQQRVAIVATPVPRLRRWDS